jgi:hypothetical protein
MVPVTNHQPVIQNAVPKTSFCSRETVNFARICNDLTIDFSSVVVCAA